MRKTNQQTNVSILRFDNSIYR